MIRSVSSRRVSAVSVATGMDRRIWLMIGAIGLFAVLVAKEIAIPSAILGLLAGIGLLGLFMLGVQSPEIPLYMLVAYLPFSRKLVGDFGTMALAFNLTNILTVWVLLAYALKRLSQHQPLFQGTPLNRVIWLFCLLGAASLIRAGWEYGSWYFWQLLIPLKRWVSPIFFYFLTLWVVRDRRTFKGVAVLIMVVTTAVALMAIREYSHVADSSFEKSRVGGIAEHSNTLGAFFVYYMFLFLGFFLTMPSQIKSWLLLIPFALCFRGIMVTFSRGAYLGFAAAGATACWFKSRWLFLVMVALALFAVANPILLPSGIRYRMGHTMKTGHSIEDEDLEQNLEKSAATRLDIWKGAVQIIKEHPLWGVGYGAFPAYIPHYVERRIGEMDAHNSYLLIAAEMGIPTLVVFFMVLVMMVYYTHWLYRHTDDPTLKSVALGFLAGLGGLCVTNMFGSRMDAQEVSGYFWILGGLVMRGVLMVREELRQGRVAVVKARHLRRASTPGTSTA